MKFDRPTRRKLWSLVMAVLSGLAVIVILAPLVVVLYDTARMGWGSFSPGFFTSNIPLPCSSVGGVVCPEGGIAPMIQGTLLLLGMASAVALPIGIGAAIFAVEFGGQSLVARSISTVADVLTGVPSILAGVFALSLFLEYNRALVFSTYSESIALAVLMVPIVTRMTEEALRTVPTSVREAALALGIPRWKTITRVVLPTAAPGIATGSLLSIARASGEAAPLLLLSVLSLHGFTGFEHSVGAIPVWIFWGATSPYQNWQALAWGASLLLILMILGLSIISRQVLKRVARKARGG